MDPSSATDAEIVACSLEDPATFAEIRSSTGTTERSTASSEPGGESQADDRAAEVFRIAFERRGDYDLDQPSAKPWLFGIASNLTRPHRRGTTRGERLRERAAGRERRIVRPEQRLDVRSRLHRAGGGPGPTPSGDGQD